MLIFVAAMLLLPLVLVILYLYICARMCPACSHGYSEDEGRNNPRNKSRNLKYLHIRHEILNLIRR